MINHNHMIEIKLLLKAEKNIFIFLESSAFQKYSICWSWHQLPGTLSSLYLSLSLSSSRQWVHINLYTFYLELIVSLSLFWLCICNHCMIVSIAPFSLIYDMLGLMWSCDDF